MTTRSQLRKAASALPESSELVDGRVRRYAVLNTVFAAVDAGDRVTLWLAEADLATVLAEHPSADRGAGVGPSTVGEVGEVGAVGGAGVGASPGTGPGTRSSVAAESGSASVAMPLADINGQQLNHWVRRAWHVAAPADLASDQSAGEVAEPGAMGDLPASIGRPATRALATAGITSLRKLSQYAERDVLALHGVGPRAVRLLAEALAAQSLTFRTPK